MLKRSVEVLLFEEIPRHEPLSRRVAEPLERPYDVIDWNARALCGLVLLPRQHAKEDLEPNERIGSIELDGGGKVCVRLCVLVGLVVHTGARNKISSAARALADRLVELRELAFVRPEPPGPKKMDLM